MRTIFKKKATPVRRRVAPARRTTSVAALAKKVAALSTKQRRLVSKVMYTRGLGITALGNVAGDGYRADTITRFADWSRIFGTDADDEQGKRCLIKNSNIQWTINTSEQEPIGISMFVVSLKNVGSELLDASGNLATLVNGTHYVGNGSKVLLNMNYFNIHYVKRWQQGAYRTLRPVAGSAPAVQSIAGETASLCKSGKVSLKYNGGKGLAVQNPSGDWKAGIFPKSDTQNYFMLTYTDNSVSDVASPFLSYTMVHTVEVSA